MIRELMGSRKNLQCSSTLRVVSENIAVTIGYGEVEMLEYNRRLVNGLVL